MKEIRGKRRDTKCSETPQRKNSPQPLFTPFTTPCCQTHARFVSNTDARATRSPMPLLSAGFALQPQSMHLLWHTSATIRRPPLRPVYNCPSGGPSRGTPAARQRGRLLITQIQISKKYQGRTSAVKRLRSCADIGHNAEP